MAGGSTELTRVTLSGNTAQGAGGGLANDGQVTLTQVTISSNSSDREGGGIANRSQARIRHSTITENAASSGAGIASTSASHTVVGDSIVSGNKNGNGADVERTGGTNDVFESLGYNLIGSVKETVAFSSDYDQFGVLDPGLESLADHGGPTQTHALKRDSPALDTGGCKVDGSEPATDQRGRTRPGSGSTACDIGAYERQGVTPQCNAVTGGTTYTSVNGRAVQMAVDAAGDGRDGCSLRDLPGRVAQKQRLSARLHVERSHLDH